MRAALNRWRKIAFPRLRVGLVSCFPRWRVGLTRVGLVGVVSAVLLFGNGCNPPPSTPPKQEPGSKEPNPKTNPKPPQHERG